MKHVCFLAVAAFLLSVPAHADEDWLEVTATLSGSSVTFTTALTPGNEYYVHCSAGARYRTCAATGTCTADAAKDMPIPSDVPIPVIPRSGRTRLAVIGSSGTCNLLDSIPRLTIINRQ